MTATIRVSGPTADVDAEVLQAGLAAEVGSAAVGEIQVHTTKGDVIALLGLAFGGIGAADILWRWWQARRDSGVEVRIETSDGTVIELRSNSYEAVRDLLAKVDES